MKIKLNLRQIRLIIIILALVILSGGIGYWLGGQGMVLNWRGPTRVTLDRSTPAEKDLDFSLFWVTWDKLSAAYLDKSALDPQQMVYGAIQGMVASLGDPYTVFLPPDDNKEAKEDLNGAFEGVGIQLGYLEEQLSVMAPLSGMPAEKAGVRAGDLILKIDGQETTGMTLPEAVNLIRGPKDTSVKLTLVHQDAKESYEVTIVRTTIIVSSVELVFPQEEIAQIKLTRFGDRTSEEWEQVVNQVLTHQPTVKGIILDLRNNPGGYLSGSVFIASEFLPSGVVVKQENASGAVESYSIDRKGLLLYQTLVVLVNQGSASASEIVAGALQESHRAEIVGEKTFGKGTIQEAEDLLGGSGLHVTTARWLLPSGKSLDKEGLMPDNQVIDDPNTETDEPLQEAIKILTD
ncbi:MAG: S41 family peptidase [Candidatus Marinimicrobia bacterium]|nr:S41 family peptidase [Candidatus Neomarinimicrobiota bacterium]